MSATTGPTGAIIPNAPFRARALELLERGDTFTDMCFRADMVDRRGRADTNRLKRALGLVRDVQSHRGDRRYGGGVRSMITDETAVRLCRALDVDPWEMGC